MGREKKLTCLSGVRVFSDGPANGEHVFHRHGADDAGDLRLTLSAVPAKLVGSELARGGVVPHVLGTDDEGPSVLVADDECPPPKQLLVRYKNGRPFVVCSNNVRDDPTSCQFTANKFGRDRGKGQSKIACIVCYVPAEHVRGGTRAPRTCSTGT